MHFPILLCYVFVQYWKVSSRMPLNSIVTALWMTSTPSKRVFTIINLNLGKRKKSHQVNRELFFLVKQFSCRPGISKCSSHPVLLRFRLTQIIGDNLPNTFMSSRLSIIRTVNRRSPHTICPTCMTLIAVLLVEGLPLLESSFTNFWPSLNVLCHLIWCYLYTLAEAFRVLVTELFLTAQSWTT